MALGTSDITATLCWAPLLVAEVLVFLSLTLLKLAFQLNRDVSDFLSLAAIVDQEKERQESKRDGDGHRDDDRECWTGTRCWRERERERERERKRERERESSLANDFLQRPLMFQDIFHLRHERVTKRMTMVSPY